MIFVVDCKTLMETDNIGSPLLVAIYVPTMESCTTFTHDLFCIQVTI